MSRSDCSLVNYLKTQEAHILPKVMLRLEYPPRISISMRMLISVNADADISNNPGSYLGGLCTVRIPTRMCVKIISPFTTYCSGPQSNLTIRLLYRDNTMSRFDGQA